MTTRIAAIQHGDYGDAVRLIGRGDPEPYFGMRHAVEVLGELFADRPHLVISLDAPAGRERRGAGELVGLPLPTVPSFVPHTLAWVERARRIRAELERFQPTHVLLRTAGISGVAVLRHAARRGLSTLAVFAMRFDEPGLQNRLVTRALVRLLNRPSVFLAGNHKQPATDSMIEAGVDRAKALAWDWPGARRPDAFPPKRRDGGGPPRVAYVGAMTELKGVGDLLEAVRLLHADGFPVELVAVGAGEDLPALRARASSLPPGSVAFPGRIGNDEVFETMRRSTVVCVPSRPEFPEGMPLTLTEALASRTPVVISDHPIFRRAFVEGEGVRFFPAKDARALAGVLRGAIEDREAYARLSDSTQAAFRRVECPTSFGDVVARWVRTF